MKNNFFTIFMVIIFAGGLGALSSYFITKRIVAQELANQPNFAIINYGEIANLVDKDQPKAVRERQAEKLADKINVKISALQERGYIILKAGQVHYAPDKYKITID